MQKAVSMKHPSPDKAPKASGTLPLAMAGKNQPVEVLSIRGRDDTRRFLAQLGFVEGCHVQVVSEMAGNLIVDVKGSRIALDRAMALRVMVA